MAEVAIVTPTYEHENFIADCIRSVLAQDFTDWEMVIVDDGSRDKTAEIAQSFMDRRIRVVQRNHNGPSGLGDSYATALDLTDSRYVAVLEGDDLWPAGKLSRQVAAMDGSTSVLSFGRASLIDDSGIEYGVYRCPHGQRYGDNDPVGSVVRPLVELMFITAVTVMIDRSTLDKIGGFYQPADVPYVDHPTWLRLGLEGPFCFIPDVLGSWRRYRRQITTTSWTDRPRIDRQPYLNEIVDRARAVLDPYEWRRLKDVVSQDGRLRYEEALFSQARLDLIDGHWGDANRRLTHLLRTGSRRTRGLALVGLAAGLIREDIEGVIAGAGRHALPGRRHQSRQLRQKVSA